MLLTWLLFKPKPLFRLVRSSAASLVITYQYLALQVNTTTVYVMCIKPTYRLKAGKPNNSGGLVKHLKHPVPQNMVCRIYVLK